MNKYIICFVLFLSFGVSGCLFGYKDNLKQRQNDRICDYDIKKDRCENAYIEQHAGSSKANAYKLAYIKIDDQGHFQSREQLNDVLDFIQRIGDKQRIVIYVHGWHHNDKENDDNLEKFRTLLASTPTDLNEKTTGIYINWNGKVSDIPLLKHLTFWDRKNVSLEVGQGALLEFLIRIEEFSKNNNSKLITIGHSFGASVVYSSIKSILLERIAKICTAGKKYKSSQKSGYDIGFGDLVVLINPAIEAIHYAPFREIVEEQERLGNLSFPPGQKPLVIIATSKKDQATGFWFKVGRLFSTVFENHTEIIRKNIKGTLDSFSQSEMDVTTIGHYDKFVTHHLQAAKDLQFENLNSTSCIAKIKDSKHNEKRVRTFTYNDDPLQTMKLTHQAISSAYNPYWIVQTDGITIPSHNEFLTPNIVCFVKNVTNLD